METEQMEKVTNPTVILKIISKNIKNTHKLIDFLECLGVAYNIDAYEPGIWEFTSELVIDSIKEGTVEVKLHFFDEDEQKVKNKMKNILTKQAVQRGVEILNNKKPGWFDRIDLEIFNISMGDYCVLGQVYYDYITGLDELEIGENEAYFGFDVPACSDSKEITKNYNSLQKEWKRVIKELKKERVEK